MSLDDNKIETNEFENDDNEETAEELVKRLCDAGNAWNAMNRAQREEQVIYFEKAVEDTAVSPIAKESNLDRSKTTDYLKACGAVEKQKEIGYSVKRMLESMSEDLTADHYIDSEWDKPIYSDYKITGGCIWLSLRAGAFIMFGFWLYILIASIVQNGIIATVEDKWFGGSMVVILVSGAIAFSKIIIQRIRYGKAKRQFKRHCKANKARAKIVSIKKARILRVISKIPPELDKLKSLSEKLYANGLIYPKYRNASALLYMAELFETNRVSDFNGVRGAYALYETYQLNQHTSDEILNEAVAIAQDVEKYVNVKVNSMPLLQKYFDTNQQLFSELN